MGSTLVVAGLALACASGPTPNVLFVTIDTFRADRLHAAGYPGETTPHLDTLAAEGALFTQAISQSPLTAPSHASMFTGLYPPAHAVRTNGIFVLPEEVTTLAELFREAGYRTGAFVGAFVLDGKFGFSQGFDVYDDAMAPGAERVWWGNVVKSSFDRPAAAVTDAALGWLETVRSEPFFLWVHYYDPHAPYDPPPDHDIFPKRRADSSYARWEAILALLSEPDDATRSQLPALRAETATLLPDLVSLYEGEIHYVDAQVGRLLDRLEAWGLARDTLVIVTSDHGESLMEHDYYFRHGLYLFENVLRVPLIMRHPGRIPPGTVFEGQVELVDLFATAAAVLPDVGSAAAPESSDELVATIAGRAGRPETPLGAGPYAYSETFLGSEIDGRPPLFSLRDSRWRYVDDLRTGPKSTRALYDNVLDPGNSMNRIHEHGALAARLRERLGALVSEQENPELAGSNRLEPDARTVEGLRALGYAQ